MNVLSRSTSCCSDVPTGRIRIAAMSVGAMIALALFAGNASAAQSPVELGTAGPFGRLSGVS